MRGSQRQILGVNGVVSISNMPPAGTYVIKLTSADGALGVARINIIH